MPRAVVDVTPVKHELKTCPPDGFVTLRRMSYDKWLHRADISMQMQIEMAERENRAKRGQRKGHMDIKQQNQAVTIYEFQNCIVEHNLEDENGTLLDFTKPQTLARLDTRIGNEIGDLINDLHEPMSEDAEGNS
jgi:hypothetical protein